MSRENRYFVLLCVCCCCRYNITQCQTGISTTNSVLEILISIQYPSGCDSTSCKQKFMEGVKSDIAKSKSITGLPVSLNNGATLNTDMNLCSLSQTESSMYVIFIKSKQTSVILFSDVVHRDISCELTDEMLEIIA